MRKQYDFTNACTNPYSKNFEGQSRILTEVQECATDFFEIGLMDKKCMEKFDALCDREIDQTKS